jgi:hypothetical protein
MRIFFSAAVLGIAGICSAQGISFGIIADPQYANTANSGTRYYRSSLTKLAQAADTFQVHAMPFVAVLGDFINGYTAIDTALALRDLDTVNLRLNRFTGEKYAVIGNHDVSVEPEKRDAVRKRLLDPDNLVASCKPIFDAVVHWGLIFDDDREHLAIEVTQEKGKPCRTEIKICRQ